MDKSEKVTGHFASHDAEEIYQYMNAEYSGERKIFIDVQEEDVKSIFPEATEADFKDAVNHFAIKKYYAFGLHSEQRRDPKGELRTLTRKTLEKPPIFKDDEK